jgi:hypothetical protein
MLVNTTSSIDDLIVQSARKARDMDSRTGM